MWESELHSHPLQVREISGDICFDDLKEKSLVIPTFSLSNEVRLTGNLATGSTAVRAHPGPKIWHNVRTVTYLDSDESQYVRQLSSLSHTPPSFLTLLSLGFFVRLCFFLFLHSAVIILLPFLLS